MGVEGDEESEGEEVASDECRSTEEVLEKLLTILWNWVFLELLERSADGSWGVAEDGGSPATGEGRGGGGGGGAGNSGASSEWRGDPGEGLAEVFLVSFFNIEDAIFTKAPKPQGRYGGEENEE